MAKNEFIVPVRRSCVWSYGHSNVDTARI